MSRRGVGEMIRTCQQISFEVLSNELSHQMNDLSGASGGGYEMRLLMVLISSHSMKGQRVESL
jgi:hypothetical protein